MWGVKNLKKRNKIRRRKNKKFFTMKKSFKKKKRGGGGGETRRKPPGRVGECHHHKIKNIFFLIICEKNFMIFFSLTLTLN